MKIHLYLMLKGFTLNNGFYTKLIDISSNLLLEKILKDNGLKYSGSIDLNSCILEINNDTISIREVKSFDEADVVLINKISLILDLEFKSIIDYIIWKNENVDISEFFQLINEDEREFRVLSESISQLEKIGLKFQINGEELDFDIAIDCSKYIKFINKDNYYKEKKINDHINYLLLELKREEPTEWIKGIYKRHLLKGNEIDLNEINHIMDWFNSLQSFDILTKSLSFEKAVVRSNEWTIKENEKLGITNSKDIEGTDLELINSAGSYKFFKLLSVNAKKREGQKMKNCIGTLHLSADNIFSVRYNDKRVASIKIEINTSKKRIIECKGPCNQGVTQSHQSHVKLFLEHFGVDFMQSADIGNLGLKKFQVVQDRNNSTILHREIIDETHPNYKESTIYVDQFWGDLFSKPMTMIAFSNQAELVKSGCKTKVLSDIAIKMIDAYLHQKMECPLSNIVVPKDQVFICLKKIDSSNLDILRNEFDNTKEWKRISDLSKDIVIFLANILEKDKLREKYPDKCDEIYQQISKAGIDSSLNDFPVLFMNVFSIKKIDELYNVFFRNLNIDLENLSKISKFDLFDVRFNEKEISYKDPRIECPNCENKQLINDQVYAIDEYNSLLRDISDKNVCDLISDIMHDFKYDVKKTKQFVFNIISEKCFNYEKGFVKALGKDDLRSIIEEVNSFGEYLESLDFDKTYDLLKEMDGEYDSFIEKVIELEEKLTEIDRHSNPSKCPGCQKCTEGSIKNDEDEDETCPDCNGDYSSCDLDSYIKDNRDSAPSFLTYTDNRTISDEIRYISDYYKSMESLHSNLKQLKQDVISFLVVCRDEKTRKMLF